MIERITETAHITKMLGKGNSYQSIITSATLGLISLFYVYTIGSYFKITIYPLIHGVTYENTFFNFYLFNGYFDHIIIVSGTILWLGLSIRHKAKLVTVITYLAILAIAFATKIGLLLDIGALISIPFIISLLIYNKFTFTGKKIVNTYPNSLFINYVALIGIIIGIVGMVISLSPILSIQTDSNPLANYSYDLFLLFSSFSPILILLLISCLPVKLFINGCMSAILKVKNKNIINLPGCTGNISIKPRFKLIYLLLFTLLSIALAIIPHYPTINKENQQVSIDTKFYVSWVNALLRSNNSQEFIQQAFIFQSHGDRGFTLIFLSGIAKIVNGDLFDVIEYLPIILGPLLVLVVYFLTRELTSNDITSLFASFLTAVSLQVLIGIYTGSYANWFALIIGYTSFVFLIKFLKFPTNKMNLIIYSALMILLLFTHVYTWSILALVTGVFLAATLKPNYYNRKSVIMLLLVVLSTVVIDAARTTISGSAGGIEEDVKFAKVTQVGAEQFAIRWSNLMNTVYILVGGQLGNFIILTLGLYWLFQANFRESSNFFIMIFLSIGLVPFLLGDFKIQTRVFYDIPFQIPAAIALCSLWKNTISRIIVPPACIWLIIVAIISVSNFYINAVFR